LWSRGVDDAEVEAADQRTKQTHTHIAGEMESEMR